MCLHLKENRLKPIIAPYNIICYKRLGNSNESRIYCKVYVKNIVNPTVNIIVEPDYDDGYIINEGYHSRNELSTKYNNKIFMIPEGTKFYVGGENKEGESNYASETIVLLGNNNMFNRWYFKQKYKLKSYINDKAYQSI